MFETGYATLLQSSIKETPSKIKVDSQSCMSMITNEKSSNRTKHIDTRFRFVQDLVARGKVILEYCPTDFNIADMLTKPLAGVKIKSLRELGNLEAT